MKQTIGLSQFQDAFDAIRPNNFSYEGLEQLFNYFESYEDDNGEQIELDVIAICCEYEESTIDEIIRQYNIEADDIEDHVFNYLAEHTSVIGRTDTSIVFQSF
jgi:Glu-tRNA(Gln) amidotransferase subunit E-like FAD-binding protein